MAKILNSTLPSGTRGLWWFAQDLQNLAPVLTGDAVRSGSTLDAGGFVLHDATTDGTTLSTNAALLVPTTAITVILDLRCTDTTLRSLAGFGVATATSTEYAGTDLPFSDGIVYWDFGGTVSGTTRLTVAWTKDTSRHVWAFTTGARGMEIWRDGVKVASNAATPSRSATTTKPFSLGRHSTVNSDLYEFHSVFVHETQLSEALIAAISADPEGELTEDSVAGGTPFEPDHWTFRGTVMPTRPATEVPTPYAVEFDGQLYVSFQGQYNNQTVGYTEGTNVRVGAIVRSPDGALWETAFDGNNGVVAGHRHWMPGQLFVIGSTLYAFMVSAGFNFVAPSAYIPAGELALFATTNGTTWTKVKTFHSWTQKNNGFGGAPAIEVSTLGAHWHARRSSAGGDDWCIVSWAIRCDGVSGTFFEAATQRYRTADSGATWDFVADMKGTYPFAGNPTTLDGPTGVTPIWRSALLGDRWFMLGGSGQLNWSDDEGTTWTASTFFGIAPAGVFPLQSGGLLIYTHGTFGLAPDVKVSCDLGETATTIDPGDSYQGVTPAGTFVAMVQFPVGTLPEGGEELLALMKNDDGLSTSIWWTDVGGELWSELGQLTTVYTVPSYLARIGDRTVFYTATLSTAGGPQVWVCDDLSLGIAGTRTICLDLTPVVEPGATRSWAWVG